MSAKPAHGAAKAHGKERNKSKDDIPFPVAYFGFILLFVLSHLNQLYNSLPSWERQLGSPLVPKFETSKLPLFAFFVMCPTLYMWRSFVKKNVFAPMAKQWAGLPPGTHKYDKFCEQAWLAAHYTLATSVGYFVLREKPWWPPVISLEAEAAITAPNAEREADQHDSSIWLLYSLQLGFYTLELVTLILERKRRSDAVMYFFHHIFTMFLMAGSWVSFHHRVGLLVLFLHDIGDIFLPIGKCYTDAEEHIRTTKTKAEYQMHKMIGMGFFVLFVIGFAIPRLIFFGALVYRAMFLHSWYACCGMDTATGYCGECTMAPLWGTVLVSTLGLLYPMHVYWFYLIVKMAARLLCSPGEYDDVRSDDEKDD